jgi:hypothetical protein
MTTIGNESRPAYVYDSETDTWVPIGVGPHTHDEYIQKSSLTNQGELLVGNSSESFETLPVGEDGQFLIVDSSEPTGLIWSTLNANIDVSDTAPVDPTVGSVWFNSSEGNSYIFYDDYWVPLSPAIVGPAGADGADGEDGATGPQGPAGDPTLTINQQTASYTVQLSDAGKLVEILSSSATNLSIPTDASVNFPIGTQISILQTGSGQVTIAAVTSGTTTVNATPGLKLRTQWSSATIIKRAANLWVATGDLAA